MVYVFLAQGFEEIEALCVVDMLRRAKIECQTIAVGDKNTVVGAHNIAVVCDCLVKNVEGLPEAVVLPGGMPGTLNLENSKEVIKIVKEAEKNGKLVAAICAAPLILGHLGLLKGKTATVYDGFEKELLGANLSDKCVVRDQNIITAFGPGAAIDFGFEIIKYLIGENLAQEVKKGMKCY